DLEHAIKDGDIGEDDGVRAEKELDQLTKKYVETIDALLKHKETELLEV
ncbi:MAG TPA: ribosome recycling factor, partial [Dermatophilaceae bacterium]|nr:ribosome recycling factor [Dermatophilaceae bacterium]